MDRRWTSTGTTTPNEPGQSPMAGELRQRGIGVERRARFDQLTPRADAQLASSPHS
jgi:hypothetical protein